VGIDHLVAGTSLLQSEVIISNSRGINTTSVAEAALGFMFMIAKKAPSLVHNKDTHLWEALLFSELKGKTLGIIGLGRIGGELAGMARALRMKLLASTLPEDNTSGVDRVYHPKNLKEMLPKCDYVVLTVPLTPETRGMIGEGEFRAMKDTAYFINVSRGVIVRESEMIKALRENWIAGAALDVFETEPLPQDSELWALPNVIISPHTAGYLEQHMQVATGLFCQNLERFISGKELINVVDKARGF
jgi:phosphoglycerate dehydrogenase-like enzyme